MSASHREAVAPVRALAEQPFSRAAGAPLVPGNSIRLLKDARENYPAWLDAIARATRSIHFESYIIHEDAVGEQFSDALIARARDGVHVRVIYDWMGGFRKTSRRFWNRLRAGGVEVRCYNAPSPASPLAWLSRDHRKMLGVDGTVGFVSGLCVGQAWVGDPARGIAPWRDTGVEVRGPAVRQIERAFAQMWALMGEPFPDDRVVAADATAAAGGTALRVVATLPNTAREDRGGGRAVGAGGLDESPSRELVRQLRARCARGGRHVRTPHGNDVPRGPGERYEIVLDERPVARRRGRRADRPTAGGGGSAGRAAAGLLRISNTVGAAVTNQRKLEPVETRIMLAAAIVLVIVGALVVVFPRLVAYPVAAVAIWIAGALFYRSYRLRRKAKQGQRAAGR